MKKPDVGVRHTRSGMNPSKLLLTMLVLTLACQTKPKQETATEAPADSAAMLAKRPGPDAPRSAADRLVRALYFEHSKTENPLRETRNRALIDQFFAKPLADQLWTRAQQSAGKGGSAAKNPLFNAPDKAIHKTWVLPAAVAGTRAVVYVTFENQAKPAEIRVDLQQVAGRWRITEMLYPDGSTLTQQR